jgi:hypothetical protein
MMLLVAVFFPDGEDCGNVSCGRPLYVGSMTLEQLRIRLVLFKVRHNRSVDPRSTQSSRNTLAFDRMLGCLVANGHWHSH